MQILISQAHTMPEMSGVLPPVLELALDPSHGQVRDIDPDPIHLPVTAAKSHSFGS